ncbi:DUF6933 domain-containing protein [Paucilactobacillus wasatchensis]|uniref:DUF6933 domain-containing protein n=1 Tax=Paucilactobacillus wasatchensis TaxID=1335616 RepID=A0A0D0Y4K1_9LACO|nr:hypothetical protein [Paucilactobacillus wasatchensis]KIS03203.1 hypothetical protein WDC_1187 [Paucilactobacillus wasatchensis]
MIINPTKKALPIFSKLAHVQNAAEAKKLGIANPFFSWHANYYSVNHKKVVLIVNDLTFAAVVLYDINAKNKGNLDQYILDGIRQSFLIADINKSDIDKYFELANKIEINAGFNRQVTGIMTNIITVYSEFWPIDTRTILQLDIMNAFVQAPFKQLGYHTVAESVQAAFKNNLSLISSSSVEATQNNYVINRTWADYHQWDQYEDDQSLLEGNGDLFEKIFNEVQANNQLLLTEFKNYLTLSEGLSKKVVNKHVENVRFFISEYLLYYTIKTPLKMVDELTDYLSDWLPRKGAYSGAELKSNAASIKKFLTFMETVGEISTKDAKSGKEIIKDGTQLGVEFLQVINNMTGFF